MDIDGRTKLVGLLGHPVEHTQSPLIHNAAYRAQGLNYRYVAFNTTPDRLKDAVRGMDALGFLGANVTIPHKEQVLSLLDEVSTQAAAVGAVNTLIFRRSGGSSSLYGDNTDVTGFLQPLAPFVEEVRKKQVLLFGTGGAARAVAYAIAHVLRPPSLCIAARRVDAAETLLQSILPGSTGWPEAYVVPIAQAGAAVKDSGLIVNATSLGMSPDVESTPWPHADDFHEGQLVYDLVYNPLQTRLLRTAASRGATCLDGMEMLIQQASASYRQFTGLQMPVDAVREALTQDQEP